ncbi:MAG: hypothetical protein JWP88_319 [Flaviaesturariibacter sp.]|nr:hypothetical protein [Flaviaesturariibacter sp.]
MILSQKALLLASKAFCIYLLSEFKWLRTFRQTTVMKNLFEPATAAEIAQRLQQLKPEQPARWGKMNAPQMLTHCETTFRVYFGELKLKQSIVGILFGRVAKKNLFHPKPWKKSLPTAKEFVIIDQKNFNEEMQKLTAQIQRFHASGKTQDPPKHPFFGKMSAEEWAILGYRHLDHHLQQFGV